MNIQNNLLYGWHMITLEGKKLLIRIPKTKTLEKMLYKIKYQDTLIDCLGIPEEFKDFDECQYLIKENNPTVRVLKNKLSDLEENTNYFITTTTLNMKQYQIRLDLWTTRMYNFEDFPILDMYWKLKRPESYQEHPKQLNLQI